MSFTRSSLEGNTLSMDLEATHAGMAARVTLERDDDDFIPLIDESLVEDESLIELEISASNDTIDFDRDEQLEKSRKHKSKFPHQLDYVSKDLLPSGDINKRFYRERPRFQLDKVPTDLIYAVMNHLNYKDLNALMQTNKRFLAIGSSHSKWRGLSVDVFRKRMCVCSLMNLLSRGIGKLSMDVCTLVPCTCGITEDEGKRYCLPNLSVLKLCSLTAKTQLPSVSISFRALSKVYLRSVDAPAFDLFFKHLIFGDSPLTILSLATCQGLDRYNVAWPVTRSKTLRKLDLSWMALEQRTVHKILHRLPNTLVHIDFSGCKDTIEFDAFELIGHQCPHLSYLALMDCKFITDDEEDIVVSKLTSLTTLRVDRTHQLHVDHVLDFATNLESIEEISAIHIEGQLDPILPLRRRDGQEILFNDPGRFGRNDLLNDI